MTPARRSDADVAANTDADEDDIARAIAASLVSAGGGGSSRSGGSYSGGGSRLGDTAPLKNGAIVLVRACNPNFPCEKGGLSPLGPTPAGLNYASHDKTQGHRRAETSRF